MSSPSLHSAPLKRVFPPSASAPTTVRCDQVSPVCLVEEALMCIQEVLHREFVLFIRRGCIMWIHYIIFYMYKSVHNDLNPPTCERLFEHGKVPFTCICLSLWWWRCVLVIWRAYRVPCVCVCVCVCVSPSCRVSALPHTLTPSCAPRLAHSASLGYLTRGL